MISTEFTLIKNSQKDSRRDKCQMNQELYQFHKLIKRYNFHIRIKNQVFQH
jgi:hypothetical protein